MPEKDQDQEYKPMSAKDFEDLSREIKENKPNIEWEVKKGLEKIRKKVDEFLGEQPLFPPVELNISCHVGGPDEVSWWSQTGQWIFVEKKVSGSSAVKFIFIAVWKRMTSVDDQSLVSSPNVFYANIGQKEAKPEIGFGPQWEVPLVLEKSFSLTETPTNGGGWATGIADSAGLEVLEGILDGFNGIGSPYIDTTYSIKKKK